MNTANSYTPNYVTRIAAQTWMCQCGGCNGNKPLLKLNWQKEQRASAELQCDSATTNFWTALKAAL